MHVDTCWDIESKVGRDDVMGQHWEHLVPQRLFQQLAPIQGLCHQEVANHLPFRVIDDASGKQLQDRPFRS